MNRIDEALTELVAAIKQGLTEPADAMDAQAQRLEDLAKAMRPVDTGVSQEAQSTATSLRANAKDLRKRAETYEGQTLPGSSRLAIRVLPQVRA